ncbi:MAG: ribbon-helix-helix domain-containing protein [Acidimicrobiales bacterium]
MKLGDDVVAELDGLVARGSFQSRSDAVRTAVAALVRSDERRRVDAAFVEGFRSHPEGDDELAEATRLAISAIEEEPWSRWW